MPELGINTTQNVVLVTEPASVGERIVATMLDYIALGVYMFIISLIIGALKDVSFAIILVLLFPPLFYSLALEATQNGQTLGKAVMKIKVVSIDGRHPSFGSYFLRWVFRIIDILLILGGIAVLTIILNGKGQRLGDIAARTMVIRTKSRVSLKDTIMVNTPDDYEPVFLETARLTDGDIQIIKDILNYAQTNMHSMTTVNLVKKAKNKIESKLGISSSLNGIKFLETVLSDYNCINKT